MIGTEVLSYRSPICDFESRPWWFLRLLVTRSASLEEAIAAGGCSIFTGRGNQSISGNRRRSRSRVDKMAERILAGIRQRNTGVRAWFINYAISLESITADHCCTIPHRPRLLGSNHGDREFLAATRRPVGRAVCQTRSRRAGSGQAGHGRLRHDIRKARDGQAAFAVWKDCAAGEVPDLRPTPRESGVKS